MSINTTPSKGNPDRMKGYLDGHADGVKCGKDFMKMKACREFSKVIALIAEMHPEVVNSDDDIKTMVNAFLKRLED